MLPYYPALRFKQGEYTACAKIARDIQKHIKPRFIIPPPKERDPEKERIPTLDEIAHWTGDRIGTHWPLMPAFLDPQFVAPILRDEGIRKLYQIARSRNPNLIPVVTASELLNPIYRDLLGGISPRLGICVGYDEVSPEFLAKGLKAIGCTANDCVLFVDFTGANLNPELAAGSISAVFDLIGESATWSRIVFQGSTFPSTNPADDGKQILISRDEWNSFHAAMKECSISPERIGYGDFGADCDTINFSRKSGGGPAIRHLRYTTKKDTLVVRGTKNGIHAEVFRNVCQRILDSGHYAGQDFSYADDRIWRIAKGIDTCGTASMWREWNMAHHMTRVVRDLGEMTGISFGAGAISTAADQLKLFEV